MVIKVSGMTPALCTWHSLWLLDRQEDIQFGSLQCKATYCLFCLFETGSCYLARGGLELVTLLFQQPSCWDLRPRSAYLSICYRNEDNNKISSWFPYI